METLKDLLDKSGTDYEFIFHNVEIKTAKEGADYFGINPGQTAPTLILRAEKSGLIRR